MVKSFNTEGPCIPGEHYMLPPERRLSDVLELIEERRVFTLHAGRQTGKTTSLMWLEQHLRRTGQWRALWVDIETAGAQPDPAVAMAIILEKLDRAYGRGYPDLERPDAAACEDLLPTSRTALLRYLRRLSELDARPLAILFDEVDGLVGEAMVSFLTQLRQGYIERSRTTFPASVMLVGQRPVRHYVLNDEDRRVVSWLRTTSSFNIAAHAMTLALFTEAEVGELLAQHTAATGQRFESDAVARIWELGQGHPWLTNVLADQTVLRDVPDRSAAVTAAHVDAAKETLILERRSHIDSLVSKLREPRVRRILEPMLKGERPSGDTLDDDFAYVLDLGLIRPRGGMVHIANPIYREVIPRALTYSQQVTIPNETAWYVRPDGGLAMAKLLSDWQVFWRKDGHLAAEGFSYREAGPHLMLMAFLQRVINGGGRIEREYGLGRGALDLMVFWRDERHAIEVKLRRDTETEEEGLDQVARCLDRAGLAEGWLVLFDLRRELSWQERLFVREVDHAGKRISIVGC
jgi:hypothetical protein